MQIQIINGTVDLSGETVLSAIDFEITTGGRVGVVGRNGCGKTTLLRVLSCELALSSGEKIVAGKPTVGILRQITFQDDRRTLVEELRGAYRELIAQKEELEQLQSAMETAEDGELIARYTALLERFTRDGGFYF